MIRIAIVEDELEYAENLSAHIRRYGTEYSIDFQISLFSDGYEIAEYYRSGQDVILLDIEMKLMDGMEAAEKIRQADSRVVLVFITNNPQYAIQGYRVSALDYLLKPVSYESFSYMMKKALKTLEKESLELYYTIASRKELTKIPVREILWVESSAGHRLTVHSAEREYETTASNLSQAEEKLAPYGFARCNSGCLVNLSKVKAMKSGVIKIGETELTVSRGKKAKFLSALADYLV